MVLLDTHVWVWWMLGQKELPRSERDQLTALARHRPPLLSDVSLWEVQMMYSKKRLPLEIPFDQWLQEATQPTVVHLLRITPAVALKLADLPDNFHGDPADRIIVATALVHDVPLLTHDRKIQRAKVVPLWS
ncbi:MAG: type II toxin-antitoxin system VapC family toxin [Spartobacteria bacterium]